MAFLHERKKAGNAIGLQCGPSAGGRPRPGRVGAGSDVRRGARARPTLLAALIRARALCKAGAKGPIVSVVFIIIIIIIIIIITSL